MDSPSQQGALSPPEAHVLLNLGRSVGREALKAAVSWMFATRILRLEEREERRWWWWPKRYQEVRVAAKALPEEPAFIGAIAGLACSDAPKLLELREFIRRLRDWLSNDYNRFLNEFIYPALIERGLAEYRRERVLWIFPVTRMRHTTAGLAETGRVEAALRQAKDIPALLNSDPARAAALAAGLGGLVLLVDELRPHYKQLAEAMPPLSEGGGGGGFFSYDIEGGFDFRAIDFDILGAESDALDAGFAGDGGGDGSGDGGGGD